MIIDPLVRLFHIKIENNLNIIFINVQVLAMNFCRKETLHYEL